MIRIRSQIDLRTEIGDKPQVAVKMLRSRWRAKAYRIVSVSMSGWEKLDPCISIILTGRHFIFGTLTLNLEPFAAKNDVITEVECEGLYLIHPAQVQPPRWVFVPFGGAGGGGVCQLLSHTAFIFDLVAFFWPASLCFLAG